MEQGGNYRKYVILQEKDPGFGVQRPPEGFARLDASKEGIMLSLQIKNLREGTEPYTVILVYGKDDAIGVIRAGTLEIISRNGFFSRKLDNDAIRTVSLQPENLLYILVAAEHQERVMIPMVGICNKAFPWNDSIRQRLRKEKPRAAAAGTTAFPKGSANAGLQIASQAEKEDPSQDRPDDIRNTSAPSRLNTNKDIAVQSQTNTASDNIAAPRSNTGMDTLSQPRPGFVKEIPTQAGSHINKDILSQPNPAAAKETSSGTNSDDLKGFADVMKNFLSEFKTAEKKTSPEARSPVKNENPPEAVEERPVERPRVDDVRLERKLKDSFEIIEPFSNPRHDYVWYRVNDLARLSNLLFACNMRIPLFANPKILVGLFKYRHLLAGFYRSEHNDMKYFVLGVPSRDDSEGRPFENISRWVESKNPDYGDMTGYWLVYINLKSGEFVR